MISLKDFLDAIQRNVNRVTHYQSGGDGQGGGCDCIGLIIGAVRLAGGTWKGTHGSNYAARYAMNSLYHISQQNEMYLGEVVYKAKSPGKDGYDLPSKYKDSGDLLDYYHVGVVTSENPLKITHCTSVAGGIKVDTAMGQWRYGGQLKMVDYNDGGGDQMEVLYEAIVTAKNGYPVKMRNSASANAKVLCQVPLGESVDVLEEVNDTWARIVWNSTAGYMKREFLRVEEAPDQNVLLDQLEEHLASAMEILALLRGGDVG